MDDDLVRAYALEAQKAMEEEANRRIAEQTDPEEEERLKNTRIADVVETEHLVPVLLSRLGPVRAALDGHGGGIAVSRWERALNRIQPRSRSYRSVFVVRCRPGYARRCPKRFGKRFRGQSNSIFILTARHLR